MVFACVRNLFTYSVSYCLSVRQNIYLENIIGVKKKYLFEIDQNESLFSSLVFLKGAAKTDVQAQGTHPSSGTGSAPLAPKLLLIPLPLCVFCSTRNSNLSFPDDLPSKY